MSRRGESIYKRKDGRWEARFVKEISVDGKKKYGSVYAKTYSEVKAKQQQHIFNPKIIESKCTLTIETIMIEWLSVIKHSVGYSTFVKYESTVKNHIIYELGKIPVKGITRVNISAFTDKLINKGLAISTINNILIVLGMGLAYTEEEYNIKCPKVKTLKAQIQEMRVLTKAEEQTLLRYIFNHNDMYCFGVLLSLYTGIRIGELCALKWSDINDGKIYITKTMQRIRDENGKSTVSISTPKSEKSNRVIPIPNSLLSIIKSYRKTEGYVIRQENNKYIEPRLMQKKFAQMVTACNIGNVHFHTLRHTFATRCIELGFDIKTLSEILGHSSVSTTLQRYVHSSFEHKQNNMNKIEIDIAI